MRVLGVDSVNSVRLTTVTVKMEITLQEMRRGERPLLSSDITDQGTCIQHFVILILLFSMLEGNLKLETEFLY